MDSKRWKNSATDCGGGRMRLIDADRLKEVLDKNFGHTGGAEVIRQIIDKQPTAYDVNKVIKDIEELRAEAASSGAEALLNTDALLINYNNGQYNAYESVINILRGE